MKTIFVKMKAFVRKFWPFKFFFKSLCKHSWYTDKSSYKYDIWVCKHLYNLQMSCGILYQRIIANIFFSYAGWCSWFPNFLFEKIFIEKYNDKCIVHILEVKEQSINYFSRHLTKCLKPIEFLLFCPLFVIKS